MSLFEDELIHCCFRTQAQCDADPCDRSWAGQKRLREEFEQQMAKAAGARDFESWVRGVRFGVFITVGFILALGAAVRIGVAIWEMAQ